MNEFAGTDIAPGGTSRLSIAGPWRIHGHRNNHRSRRARTAGAM
jgi:hypothetical protein